MKRRRFFFSFQILCCLLLLALFMFLHPLLASFVLSCTFFFLVRLFFVLYGVRTRFFTELPYLPLLYILDELNPRELRLLSLS